MKPRELVGCWPPKHRVQGKESSREWAQCLAGHHCDLSDFDLDGESLAAN